jgi:hypothetical protein
MTTNTDFGEKCRRSVHGMICAFCLACRPEVSKYLMRASARPVPHLMQTAQYATLTSSSCGLFDPNTRVLPGQKLQRLTKVMQYKAGPVR